jgi:lysophospholipase L1-like esterase
VSDAADHICLFGFVQKRIAGILFSSEIIFKEYISVVDMVASDSIHSSVRILIISSSESLSRIKPEYCAYDDTWPALLRRHFYVYQMSVGGNTIDILMNQLKVYHMAFEPDIIITQAGINDCVPRTLRKRELKLLTSFGIGRWFLNTIIKKYSRKIRAKRNITYTTPDNYRRHFDSIRQLFPKAHILPISILHPLPQHESIVNGLTKRVEEYNAILKALYPEGYVSIREIPAEGVMTDYIHFNPLGHTFIYNRVMELIKTLTGNTHSEEYQT